MIRKLFTRLNKGRVKKEDEMPLKVSSHIQETVHSVELLFSESDDVIKRELLVAHRIPATIFYIQGMCDEHTLENHVMKPLTNLNKEALPAMTGENLAQFLSKEVMTLSNISIHPDFDSASILFMSGDPILVIDGVEQIFILEIRKYEKRKVEQPQSEVLIRGPRDGFTEDIETNIVLLRKRIKDPNLIVQTGALGRRAKKSFGIAYLKGIVNPDLVDEVRYRISCIDTDDISESGTLEQFIEDNSFSPFPQLLHTERPDRTADALLSGNVVILLDGTPFCLHAPVTLARLLKAPEDYYDRWAIMSLIRVLRFLAAFISLFLSSIYIALTTYHQGMIPTTLALSIAGTREGVPFPAFIEAILMEFTIELLREAGIRLPRPIGQTIGIVGGLVIGEAAIQAGIVSPILAVLVAVTAISSFAIPNYSVSIAFRMLRFVMMIMAAAFGLYGIIIAYMMINIHLVGLRSFGSYYLSPFAPYTVRDWKDLLIRAPLTTLRIRKAEPKTLDSTKQQS